MDSKPVRVILCFLGLLVLSLIARVVLGASRIPTSGQSSSPQQTSSSEENKEAVPMNSVPQYLPCSDQTKLFKELSNSFANGRLPSPTEVDGAWVLIGSWLHKDSRPDLNCNGIRRGKIFEWVLLADGNSFGVDMAGMFLTSSLEPDHRGDLAFTIDLQGDYNPVFRCRMTRRNTLVCLGTPYYSGSEFKKMQVNCEPLTPEMVALNQARLCMPYKQR
jgi:hypothetical protein